MIKIALLPGDGIGPEVLAGPTALLGWLADRGELECTGPWPVGASSFAESGQGLPTSTVQACEAADAILLGAVGDHPGVATAGFRPELALLGLREHFDLRVSIRQVWQGVRPPLTVVRNLLGGAYAGSSLRTESDGTSPASDTFMLEPGRIAELADIAISYVKRTPDSKLLSVDKANLLATSRLWRRVATEAASSAGIDVRHVYVDRMAFELAAGEMPNATILTEGLFGDILSDLASARAGSIALCSSASIRPGEPAAGRCVGLFEPVHGSAPRRAGANMANPSGGYLALAALLEWFPETAQWAKTVRDALTSALDSGHRTYDLAVNGDVPDSTEEFSAFVNRSFFELSQ